MEVYIAKVIARPILCYCLPFTHPGLLILYPLPTQAYPVLLTTLYPRPATQAYPEPFTHPGLLSCVIIYPLPTATQARPIHPVLLSTLYPPRPVFAIIEVDVYKVDPSKRAKVKEEVTLALGPPDPTIVIEEQDGGSYHSVQELLEVLRKFGEVVLVRYV